MKILCTAALVLASAAHAEVALLERYPGPWTEDMNIPISRALVKNSIRGCGEYKYRPSNRDKGEFLVYCTRDGQNWEAYLVWTSAGKVTGPHQISAAIPP